MERGILLPATHETAPARTTQPPLAGGCGDKMMLDFSETLHHGDSDLDRSRFVAHARMTTQDAVDQALLHWIVFSKDLELLETALQMDADPNAPGKGGWTSLHVAALIGSAGGAKLLLGKGAQPNTQDEAGCTPLHLAAEAGEEQLETIGVLLENGADPNVRDVGGRTPLHRAVDIPNVLPESVGALLDAGADPTIANDFGESPEDLAQDNPLLYEDPVFQILRQSNERSTS